MTNNVFDTLIKMTIEENESIKETIIESMMPSENEHGWWQVEHTINEIIESLECDLYLEDLIEKNGLKNIINNSDRNIRDEMFKILIEPITEYYNDNEKYDVEVDSFWEEIRVYNTEKY